MNIIEVFKQAFESIRANKLRSYLTLLAISVGVFAIMSANTAVLVLDTYFKDTLNLMGGDVVVVTRTPTISMGPTDWERFRNRQNITIEQMQRLEEVLPQSRGVGPSRNYRTTRVSSGERETEPNVSISGGNEHFLQNNAFNLEDGRNFLPEDVEFARAVAILGADVVTALFPNENPLGKIIRVEGRPYTVIGIAEAKGNVFGSPLDRFIVIPYTHLAMVYGRNLNIAIQARAGSVEQVAAVIDELTGILRAIRKVNPGDPNDFEITTNESLGNIFNSFTAMLYLIGFVIGGIVLLGAGIGVMNIMLVSVTERTKEIGIRKAIGASSKAIVSQFLLECIAICQIGGIIGILMGVLLGNAAALWLGSAIVIPWSSAFVGILGITFIGVLFGVYPAFKAARLDPIESLRYE